MVYIYMLAKLGYVDGKCYYIWYTWILWDSPLSLAKTSLFYLCRFLLISILAEAKQTFFWVSEKLGQL